MFFSFRSLCQTQTQTATKSSLNIQIQLFQPADAKKSRKNDENHTMW